MKIKRFLVVIAAFSMLAACGGSGGGSSDAAKAAAIASFNDFGDLIGSAAIQACIAALQVDCPCPGGGTVTTDAATLTSTLTNCKSDSGGTYNGTIGFDAIPPTRAQAQMSVFDECTNATGDVATSGECDGSFNGTCAGGSVSCTVVDDASTGGCTLSC